MSELCVAVARFDGVIVRNRGHSDCSDNPLGKTWRVIARAFNAVPQHDETSARTFSLYTSPSSTRQTHLVECNTMLL